MSDDDLAAWLAQGDNADERARLRDALALTDGFALFLVRVPDIATQTSVVALLESEAAAENKSIILADALGTGADAPVRRFLTVDAGARPWLLLTTLAASRTDVEALERCFLQLNMKRDQLVARARSPMIVLLRPDALRRLVDVAPDLYSVHASQFRFVSALRSPLQLLADQLEQLSLPADIHRDIADAEFDRAVARYQATQEAIERQFGPHDRRSLMLLALGVGLFDATAQPVRALDLAYECWRRLQYVDEARPEILIILAELLAEYGPESRFKAIRARWQQDFPDLPWPLPARQAPA